MIEVYSCTKCGAWLYSNEVYLNLDEPDNPHDRYHLREREGNVIYLDARCGPVHYIGALPEMLYEK